MSTLCLPCRYYRHQTDPNRPNDEASLEYGCRMLPLPLEQSALVLVDCWNAHHNDGWLARARRCMVDRVVPALQAARAAGMLVVHCPSLPVAKTYPQYVKQYADLSDPIDLSRKDRPPVAWPPREFLMRQGPYAAFEHPPEPRPLVLPTAIADCCRPRDGELVVGTGVQLHQVCAERKLLHLIYAGFAANMCVLNRTYGMRSMQRTYGYNVVLLRDASIAFESHDTLAEESQLRFAIREIEIQLGWTATVDDFRRALRRASEGDS